LRRAVVDASQHGSLGHLIALARPHLEDPAHDLGRYLSPHQWLDPARHLNRARQSAEFRLGRLNADRRDRLGLRGTRLQWLPVRHLGRDRHGDEDDTQGDSRRAPS